MEKYILIQYNDFNGILKMLYGMLKKYIDPQHPRPLASCNCSMSYAGAFNKLRDWVGQNGNKFS